MSAVVVLSMVLVLALIGAAIATMLLDDDCPQLARMFGAICTADRLAPEA